MKAFKVQILTVVWCWISFLNFAHSARILGVFPIQCKSHFGFQNAIMDSLLEAGHEVTIVAPFTPQYPHDNLTFINSRIDKDNDVSTLASRARADVSWFSFLLLTIDVLEKDCYHVLSMSQIEDLRDFDVMFVEMLPMAQCYSWLSKKLGIPVIGTMSLRSFFNADDSIGNPRNPSVFPTEFSYISNQMTFYDRFLNFIDAAKIKVLHMLEEHKLATFYRKFLSGQMEYRFETSLLFVNNHPSVLSRASVPNSIDVGGIHVKSAPLKPLPKNLKSFLDEASHGVILFSLGSIATNDALSEDLKDVLRESFAKIPQRILWKFDGTIEGLSDNVLLSKWLPQKEILAHENVLAFITHSGLCSTYEAIHFGKPLIMLPIFIDQPSIAGILSDLGVGLDLNILELTAKKLSHAIQEILNNTKYRDNMEELSRKFNDQPIPASELVVFWTEYVIRHRGAAHMKSSISEIPLYQYLLVDVIVVIALIVLLVSILIFFLVKLVLTILFTDFRISLELEDDCFLEKKSL